MQGVWVNLPSGYGHKPDYTPENPISPALVCMPMQGLFLEYNPSDGVETPYGLFNPTQLQWTFDGNVTDSHPWGVLVDIEDHSMPAYIRGADGLTPFTTLDAARPYFGAVRLWCFGLRTTKDYGPYAQFAALDTACLQLLGDRYPAYIPTAQATLFSGTRKMQSKYIGGELGTTGAIPTGAMDNMLVDGNSFFSVASGSVAAGGGYSPITATGISMAQALLPKRSTLTPGGNALLFGGGCDPTGLVITCLSPYPVTLSYEYPSGEIRPTWTATAAADAVAPRITYDSGADGVLIPLCVTNGAVVWQRDDGFTPEILGDGYSYLYHAFWLAAGSVVT